MKQAKHLLVLSVCFGTLTLADQQSPWSVTCGAAWRSLGGVEINAVRFRNAGNVLQGPFGVQDYLELPVLFDGSGVTVDNLYVKGKHADFEGQSAYAPFVALRRDLLVRDRLTLSLQGSFQFQALDASLSASKRIRGTHYNYVVMGGQVAPPPVSEGLAGFSPGLRSATVSADFEADLFILDVGIRAEMPLKAITLSVAAGPTLAIADMTTKVATSASWNPIPGADDSGAYRERAADSRWRTAFGIYGSVGITLSLSDRIALELAARYDWAGQELSSDHASLQLDGASARLSVTYRF